MASVLFYHQIKTPIDFWCSKFLFFTKLDMKKKYISCIIIIILYS